VEGERAAVLAWRVILRGTLQRRKLMNRELVGRPMEILLIEDNFTDAALTIRALERGQVRHRLTLVRDGAEALEFLRRQGRFARAPRPDLILLDLNLPRIDGRELLSDLKSDDDLSSIPVVIMTGSEDYEDELRSQRLNVEGYVTKPVDMPKFLSIVKELKDYWMSDVILPNSG
jgi:CheY-like chemotaxis protein